ncbi:unnamed protein product [Lepeophtheirus salmonis]|uniref:(salmon louse) hypothetical protein n=1 Tax=Lepeophtheirus salmonis TaxID=72036 RepID=A0A7R8HDJ0_LEPSM|nr:unnamed protein product [Lepeophtheirus salmonis]CAF3030430.1 unnamed protein product [Lepeophtheirus salmonis]
MSISITDLRYKQLPTLNESEEDYNEPRTESSSSWTDDEFEFEASTKIHDLFHGIEAFLYEDDASSINSNLCDELTQWKETFPHLRVLGTGIKSLNPQLESEEVFLLNPPSESKFDSLYKQIIEDLSVTKISGSISRPSTTSMKKKKSSKKSYNRLSILPSLRSITSAPLVRENDKRSKKESLNSSSSSKKDVILPPIVNKSGISRNTLQRRTFPDRKLFLKNQF